MVVLVALLVCLIPTTIGALLSAIGIAGMDRLVQRNVLAMSGRAVEAAGDVSTLLLDKTGTITLGNRQAAEFVPVSGDDRGRARRRRPAVVAGRRDARGPLHRRPGEGEVRAARAHQGELAGAEWIDFTAQTRMSGVDVDGRKVRKGAAGSVVAWVQEQGGAVAEDADSARRPDLRGRRHPAAGRRRRRGRGTGAGRHPPQGRRQGGHAGAVRRNCAAWASGPS